MLLTHQNKPSLWGALLWKDFQQVKLAFVVLVGGALCMQLLFLIIALLTSHPQSGPLLTSLVGMASVTPILLALACSGMLIGHERQSGSWAWSSSLPVSWGQSLCSKLIVATLGSLFASLPLGIIPAIFSSPDVVGWYSSLTLVIFLQVIVLCFLATLLVRDTLVALLAAGTVLTVLHSFSSIPILHSWPLDRFGISADAAPRFWFVFLSASILTVGLGLLVAAFRWRWTYGQLTKIAFWQERASAIVRGDFRYRESCGARPNEWWLMFVHSFRNNFVMGLLILANLIICTVIFLRMDAGLHFFFALLALLALGMISFQGDQMQGRFRFLADRGFAPWKLVLSRLVITLGMAVPVYAFLFVALASGQFDGLMFGFFAGAIAFSLGALASLCFRTTVMAIGAALIVGVFGMVINITLHQWVLFDQQILTQFNGNAFGSILVRYLPIGALIVLVSLFWLARRWLVLDKPNLAFHFLWVSALALLAPFGFACTFGFLAIPFSPELTRQVESTSSSEREVQNYFSISEPLLVGDLPGIALLSRYQSGTMHMIEGSAHGAVSTIQNELKEKGDLPISELINPVLQKLDGLQHEAKVPMSYQLQNILNLLIVRTAAMASIALKEKEADLGLRLWKLNRELQDMASEANAMDSQGARKTAMFLLLELSGEDVQLIGGSDIYQSLIPSVADERSVGIEYSLARERNTLQQLRQMSSSAITPMHWLAFTRFFPPLRWLYERELVNDYRRQRAYLSTSPKNYLTGDVRRQLEQRVRSLQVDRANESAIGPTRRSLLVPPSVC